MCRECFFCNGPNHCSCVWQLSIGVKEKSLVKMLHTTEWLIKKYTRRFTLIVAKRFEKDYIQRATIEDAHEIIVMREKIGFQGLLARWAHQIGKWTVVQLHIDKKLLLSLGRPNTILKARLMIGFSYVIWSFVCMVQWTISMFWTARRCLETWEQNNGHHSNRKYQYLVVPLISFTGSSTKYALLSVYSWKKPRTHLQCGSCYFSALRRHSRKALGGSTPLSSVDGIPLWLFRDFGNILTWKMSWSAIPFFTLWCSKREKRKARRVPLKLWAWNRKRKSSHSVWSEHLRTTSNKLRFIDKLLTVWRIGGIMKCLTAHWRTRSGKCSETESLMNLMQTKRATIEILGLLSNITCALRSWAFWRYLFFLQKLARYLRFNWFLQNLLSSSLLLYRTRTASSSSASFFSWN